MPEAAMHKDDLLPSGEYDVRFARQASHMKSKSISHGKQ